MTSADRQAGGDGSVGPGELVAAMGLEEKVGLLAGVDLWHTAAVPRLGVPALRTTDGPNGARGTRFTGGPASACFPCGTALAATFDPDLVAEVGAALGREARAKGAQVLLAPTLNLHRSPLGGRNFECFSEDPHVAARMAVAYVRGVQSQGVASCVKHFVANDTEFERTTISSEVDERTLRELYLVPFEAAVREAGARAVMAAYNRVNGTYASEHAGLLGGVLRGEWGFDGVVMSDWAGLRSTAEAMAAGCDLEMPGPPVRRGARLVAAVRDGRVGEEEVDASARRLVGLATWAGASADGEPGPEEAAGDDPATRALLRRAAAAGMVLLRNEGGLLPLDSARCETLAVIGPNAEVGQVQGGGSAQVRPPHVVGPLEAIASRLPAAAVRFARGCAAHRTPPPVDRRRAATDAGAPGIAVEYRDGEAAATAVAAEVVDRLRLVWMGPPAEGVGASSFTVRAAAWFTPDETGPWTWSLTSVGPSRLWLDDELVVDNSEPSPGGGAFFGFGSAVATGSALMRAGRSQRLLVEYRRRPGAPLAGLAAGCAPPAPADSIEQAVAAAAGADAAVLVVGTDDEEETEGADRERLELPGPQDELVRRVAAANPNTVVVVNAGSPVAMPWAEDAPAVLQAWFPGQEFGPALADVVFGDAEPGGRLPTTVPARLEDTPAFLSQPGEAGVARYAEGLFVGYRWYDARRIEPRYPFGHGLGYARFDYGPLAVEGQGDGGGPVVALELTNSSSRAGAEVVQLYVRPVAPRWRRPDQELRAFAKVHLAAGETRTVRLALDRRAFSFWDPVASAWATEPAGRYELRVGRSSRDVRSTARWAPEEG